MTFVDPQHAFEASYPNKTARFRHDLTKDPRETRNLWDDPAHASTKAELSLRMIDHLTAQMDESPRARRRA